MTDKKIKESIIYRTDLVLKDRTAQYLEEHEYRFSHTQYNEQGLLTCEAHYDDRGNKTQEHTITYNETGLIASEKVIDGDGLVSEHKRFEYDDNAKLVKEYHYYMDDTCDTINYTYDGDRIVKETIDCDNECEAIEELQYDDGLLVSQIIKDQDDEVLVSKEIRYNQKKHPEEIREYDASEGSWIKTVNEYYGSGNKKSVLVYNDSDQLIERTLLTEDPKGRIIEVIEENSFRKNTIKMDYDDQGNIIVHHEYDRNGELISKVERSYDEFNNLISSKVFMNGTGRSLSKNYTLRQEYIYY